MTLSEMKASVKDYLTPAEVAKCLGCTAYALNQQADFDADKLGFPVIRIGRRLKIPRVAFIRFMEGAKETDED